VVAKTPPDGLDEVFAAVQEAYVHESRQRSPAIEIIEEPNAFVLACDMPGAEREDIRVDVSPHRIVIAALPRPALDAFRPRVNERASYSQFERAIPLPSEVDPETAEARLNNGILEVVLPKRQFGGVGVYSLPAE
jgi:HSP20 family protein